jgi:hypothetical protein
MATVAMCAEHSLFACDPPITLLFLLIAQCVNIFRITALDFAGTLLDQGHQLRNWKRLLVLSSFIRSEIS